MFIVHVSLYLHSTRYVLYIHLSMAYFINCETLWLCSPLVLMGMVHVEVNKLIWINKYVFVHFHHLVCLFLISYVLYN
jgi:hypothetical protein